MAGVRIKENTLTCLLAFKKLSPLLLFSSVGLSSLLATFYAKNRKTASGVPKKISKSAIIKRADQKEAPAISQSSQLARFFTYKT